MVANSAIKPIETHYKGYRFRSRLEARWAVFFDALGVKWEYEPEGYDLTDEARELCADWRKYEKELNVAHDDFSLGHSEKLPLHLWHVQRCTIEWLESKKRILYLPDFKLHFGSPISPKKWTFVEIKPYYGEGFWGGPIHWPIETLGGILLHGEPASMHEQKYEVCIFDDVYYFLGHCDKCGTFGCGYCAWHERICNCGAYYRKEDMTTTPTYLAAVAAARSARFEHGETPNTYQRKARK